MQNTKSDNILGELQGVLPETAKAKPARRRKKIDGVSPEPDKSNLGRRKGRSVGEAEFMRQWLLEHELPPVEEYPFHPSRRWRFDFAWPEEKLALEVEGGSWTSGRHNRGAGYETDCEKYSAAAILGWRIIRATTGQVKKGLAIEWVTAALDW